MSTTFKRGDRVRCIDPGISSNYLTYNKVYEVLYVDDDMVTILDDDGDEGQRFSYRFELDTESKETDVTVFNEGDRVRCIREGVDLTEGNVYEVLATQQDSIRIKDDVGDSMWWDSGRFERVESEQAATPLKEGDRAEVVTVETGAVEIGDQGVIASLDSDDAYVWFRPDVWRSETWQGMRNDHTWIVPRSSLKKVETPYEPTTQHLEDAQKLYDALKGEAERRGWCSDFTRFLERLNGTLTVPLTPAAPPEPEWVKGDVVKGNISALLYYFDGEIWRSNSPDGQAYTTNSDPHFLVNRTSVTPIIKGGKLVASS